MVTDFRINMEMLKMYLDRFNLESFEERLAKHKFPPGVQYTVYPNGTVVHNSTGKVFNTNIPRA